MIALAERLRAAAERLSEMDEAAVRGPWTVYSQPRSAGQHALVVAAPLCEAADRCDSGCGAEIVQTKVLDLDEMPAAKADLDLIVALRDLAPVIASQLRQHAVMAQNIEIAPIGGRPFHDSDDCGGGWLDGGEGDLCQHFDDALALADAILGGQA